MTRNALAIGVAGLMIGALAAPTASLARHRHHVHRTAYVQHSARDARCVRGNANTGTVVGAVAGGVLGHVVSGHGAAGPLIGAGAGAVAGHQIAKHNAHC